MSWQSAITHIVAFGIGALFGYAVACLEARRVLKDLDERRRTRQAKDETRSP